MRQSSSWWTGESIPALLRDLIAEHWRRFRPQSPLPAVLQDPGSAAFAETTVDEDGLGADSLELLQLVTAVATFFRLYETGIEDRLLMQRRLGDWVALVQRSLSHFDRAVGFASGGSTGEPKVTVHGIAALEAEAEALAAIFAGRGRVVALVPRHHIYGFIFTVLLPRALGAECLDKRGVPPSGLGRHLAAGDLVVGFPEVWRMAATDAPGWPRDIEGVSATAPCPDSLARALTPKPLTRLVQVYGSTETAGVGWREAPGEAYRLLPHWRRGAGNDSLLRRESDGSETEVAASDRLDWRDAEHFDLAGRRDSAVQVGGVNVDPGAVARVLEDHPAVAQAAVRLMTPEEGARLKAFVVPADSQAERETLRAALTDHLTARLSAPERPRAITFGPALPRSPLGKAADWPISAPQEAGS